MRTREKKVIIVGLVCLLLAYFSNSVYALDFADLEGAVIVAQDKEFLGVISIDKYDSDSIANRYGSYGSKYSSKCIFNHYSRYGSEYSSLSAFNSIASSLR